MQNMGIVEDTLFVPLLGRIYASERFPNILRDDAALSLKDRIPRDIAERGRQTQYTLIASAARSANMDRIVEGYLARNPEGAVVQLGCGLETAAQRSGADGVRWYAVDLPAVIEYRRALIPECSREECIGADAFSREWIELVRLREPDSPILVTAAGLFHYFEEGDVVRLLKTLRDYGDVEVAFDAVSRTGLAMMGAKYMRQVGHGEARMGFCVGSAARLAEQVGAGLVAEGKYYESVPRAGLAASTRASMALSDFLSMVKMVHLDPGSSAPGRDGVLRR